MDYITRFADNIIEDRLKSAGAVLVEGPKGCGKTETSKQHAKSLVHLDTDDEAKIRMEIDPRSVLLGEVPRLIDEWQEYPKIWNYARREIDDRKKKGQFILTGSSNPEERVKLHSGAARFSLMKMRPMSLYERGWSTGEVSLEQVMKGNASESETVAFDLGELAEKITLGGWPSLLGSDAKSALRFIQDYVSMIVEVDISRVSEKKRNPQKVRRLMQSLSRNISTLTSVASLALDTGGEDTSIKEETVADYLDALDRLMIYEALPAWSAHIRSAHTLRKAPKRHFVCPSIAVGTLGLSVDKILADLNYFGFLFESLAIRDLRIYADVNDGKVFHYRDSSDLEADAIVEYPDGTWAAFEVKLGIGAADGAAKSLIAFAERVDTKKMGAPVSLNVITGNGFAHRRKDGVNVIPLSTLTV
ncbi:ATPase AAA [Clostridia bacterium]|nr:ATPase AAA [Clostridia bacterium]